MRPTHRPRAAPQIRSCLKQVQGGSTTTHRVHPRHLRPPTSAQRPAAHAITSAPSDAYKTTLIGVTADASRLPVTGSGSSARADALWSFGITGDLARVMTFRLPYRLERRGLLDCPVVGVAVDDWTVEQLRAHARESIAATGETKTRRVCAFAARLYYVSGDFGDPGDVRAGRGCAVAMPNNRSSIWRSRQGCSQPWSRDSRTRA